VQPKPPISYRQFTQRHPRIAEGWETIAAAGREGPLDEKTIRLVKLGLAIGAGREGAVRANIRKALVAGKSLDEIDQVMALTAGTLGLSETVAVYTWIRKALTKEKKRTER